MSNYDLLITGAQVVDGTGNPWFYGDVAIQGDRIAAITRPGEIAHEQVARVVDATGMVVCPGFIDILSHSIVPLMVDAHCLSKIAQGVTTEIMGEDNTPVSYGGFENQDSFARAVMLQLAPEWKEMIPAWTHFHDWLEAMVDRGVSPNIGSFLGGGTLRKYAMGMEMGDANADQLEVMKRLTADAMEEGAFGISYALIYTPSAYVSTAELVEVCKVVAQYNGIYITHVRSESDGLEAGYAEALAIGRAAQLPVHTYHLKAAGARNWHKIPALLATINEARAASQDITCDMYPYVVSGTGLTSVLPPWSAAGGKLYENLSDPAMRAKIRGEALDPAGDWEAMADLCGPEGVMPVGFTKAENQKYVGKRLSHIAEMRGQEWIDAAMDLLVSERQRISTLYFMIDEENLKLQLQQPWVMIGTDAGGLDPAWAAPLGPYHPRAYGSYARILGKYVREEKVLPLEDAVRKMSWAVASRLGLVERGRLHPGCFADVVIFDPATIIDRATVEQPHQLATGVRDVWVNGVQILANGSHTGATPGRIVSGPGRKMVG